MQVRNVRLIFIICFCCLLPVFAVAQAGTAIYFQNEAFDSHGDFIYCGQPNYSFSDQLSVATWVKWTVNPGTYARTKHAERESSFSTYLAYTTHNTLNTGTEEGLFWLRNTKTGNQITFTVENSSGTQVTVTSSTKPAADTWYYITGTYDGTTVKLYIDGTLEDSGSLSGSVRSNTDCRLTMGRLPWGYGFFAGYMDEARVWNTALTITEINAQMNSASTIQNAKCLSYWNFNTGSGTDITDSQGNANGTFYSALVDVHGSSDFDNKIINDSDRDFVTGAWNGKTLVTVAGAGVDETNIIVSNTDNVFTMTYGFGGDAPDNRTTPVVDDNVDMTWFGILAPDESSQWVSSSDLSLPVCLGGFSASVRDASVSLVWFTESETENLGFVLERRHSPNVPFHEIASYLKDPGLEGQGSTPQRTDYEFIDRAVERGKSYEYRLSDIDYHHVLTRHPTLSVTVGPPKQPQRTSLLGVNPNPFNPSTTISYVLPEESNVSLVITNVRGQTIRTLESRHQSAGWYDVTWNGETDNGRSISTGIYFARLVAGDYSGVIKILYLE